MGEHRKSGRSGPGGGYGKSGGAHTGKGGSHASKGGCAVIVVVSLGTLLGAAYSVAELIRQAV